MAIGFTLWTDRCLAKAMPACARAFAGDFVGQASLLPRQECWVVYSSEVVDKKAETMRMLFY